MIKSMTGFGRGESEGWITELRSVNHRFGEISYKIPRNLASLDGRFREKIKKRVKRGRLDISCSPENSRRNEALTFFLDEALADQVYGLLKRLNERYGFRQDPDLKDMTAFREIFRTQEESPDIERIWETVCPSLEAALDSLDQMRVAEGENLVQGIKESLRLIQGFCRKCMERSPQIVEMYRERLLKRFKELLPENGLDQGRLLQEVLLFSDRSDIGEELTRLMSHIHQVHEAIDGEGPHGRRLEFLLQEMNREVNTIGSKGNDLLVSQWVVECKCELEKIREQIQNVE